MASLSALELQTLRRSMAARSGPTWTKPQINAAVQAIEDAMVSTSNVGARSVRAYISLAIEGVAAGVFSAAQKDDLFIVWSFLNARRGGVI